MKSLKTLAIYLAILLSGLLAGYLASRVPAFLEPKFHEGDFSPYLSKSNTEILMYGTASCEYCAKTRAFFSTHHINYIELDIEKSPDAAMQHAQLQGSGVPLVIIGNRKISGFRPDVFKDALSILNKSSTPSQKNL